MLMVKMIVFRLRRAGCCRSRSCGCVLTTELRRQKKLSVMPPSWTTSLCQRKY